MDYWGNIPFSTDFSDRNPPQQKSREFVYEFIVQEITENADKLQEFPTPEFYGRVTKGMAYTLLAKMYLNAQEWVGQNKFAANHNKSTASTVICRLKAEIE